MRVSRSMHDFTGQVLYRNLTLLPHLKHDPLLDFEKPPVKLSTSTWKRKEPPEKRERRSSGPTWRCLASRITRQRGASFDEEKQACLLFHDCAVQGWISVPCVRVDHSTMAKGNTLLAISSDQSSLPSYSSATPHLSRPIHLCTHPLNT